MISNKKYFEVSFPNVPKPVVDVWRCLVGYLEASGCLPSSFIFQQITGHPERFQSERDLKVSHEEVADLIQNRDLFGFAVDTGHSARSVAFSMTKAKTTGDQTVLSCRIECQSKTPADWSRLIEGLLSLWPGIGGWQWDNLYKVWQGTISENVYEANFGAIPPGVRMVGGGGLGGHGKPKRKFIDVSLNPGRAKELLPMVNFYPSSEMWLGPHFWQYASCTKQEVLDSDIFLIKRDLPNFLYLKTWPEPFRRPDGEQGRIQQKLWRLLFHEDCEWPPSSGGISDKPIYGPPELMPRDEIA
ncbi:hypothetical protein OKA05_08295 [Luteolibacter arcticus]|uniref:Uncharacterized protein n=1 Tax=Luteolibacter arcticus TaxID=1581411 RepID=A0ABT3GG14_9BACT|nr:hypothetical protein [Luteolibacter arcticus]MCW1922552.1 hypothetical protein [Luteolibacter arcticus]